MEAHSETNEQASQYGQLSAERIAELYEIFGLLASETRLKILSVLAQSDDISVNDLACEVGMNTQAVSNQLRLLESSRVLKSRREGKKTFYRLDDHEVASFFRYAISTR